MRTLSPIRVWNWLALTGLLLFCFGPFAAAQKTQGQPSPKTRQHSASGHASTGASGAAPSPHTPVEEDENYLRAREEWFLEGRRLPDGSVGAGMRLKALEQLDEMIEAQKKMGLLPPDGAVPPLTGFPGPTTWTLIGPQPIIVPPPQPFFFFPFFGSPFNTGRVAAIAVSPQDRNLVFLGAAAGGVWKSTNGGANWAPLTDGQPSLSVGSIAIDPTNSSIIYIGTGEANNSGDSYYGAGVLKSTDGGNNWTQQGANVFVGVGSASRLDGGAHIGAIAVDPDPNNNQIVLAGASFFSSSAKSGIYRTTNGGANWSSVPVLPGAPGTSIVFDPNNRGVVYAALGAPGASSLNGVYKSTDHGLTWTKLVGTSPNLFPTTGVGRIALALVPGTPATTTIYAAVANSNGSSFRGLFKTMDSGVNWTQLTVTPDFCSPQCSYDIAIAVHPANSSIVYAGGSAGFLPSGSFINEKALIRSTNGGATWSSVSLGANGVNLHADLHALVFSNPAAGPVRLYIGNDGGAWSTDNPDASAIVYNGNLNSTLAISMHYPGHGISASDENVGFVGSQDVGTARFSGSLAWDDVLPGGDGGQTAIDPLISSTVYTTCQFLCIFRSMFDGISNLSYTPQMDGISPSDRFAFIAPLTHDPTLAGRLYFGSQRVYLTTDFADNWAAISPDLTAGSPAVINAIAVAKSDSNVVYAGTSTGGIASKVQKTTTALSGTGATWTDITNSTVLPTNRSVTAIAVDKINSSLVYVTYTGFSFGADTKGHVFRSPDGTTWQDISGSGMTALPNVPANDIVADPDLPNTLYVATDIGVFTTSTAGTANVWTPMGSGLPNVVVLSLNLRKPSRILRASTSGRSTWIIQLTNVLPSGPFLSSVHPSSAPGGSPTLNGVILDGANFTLTSKVQWDGPTNVLPTTFVSANQLTATIDASLLTSPGVHNIRVVDGANTSDDLHFNVTNAVPTIATFSPSIMPPGSPDFPLTVTGTNYNCSGGAAKSVVRFRGTNHTPTPTSCSSTSVTVNIAASEVRTGGLAPVLVFTFPPGGGDSNTVFFQVGVPPPNDDFLFAINANPVPFTDVQDNTGATTNTGGRVDPTPSLACVSGFIGAGRFYTIWYKFTPTSTVSITANTFGSVYDTVLDVVTGSPGSFTEVACNDDFGGTFQSQVTFTANAGTTYFFMIGGFDDSQAGPTVFHLLAPPPNDNFANAKNASAGPFSDVQDTSAATTETGEPVPPAGCTTGQSSSTKSIWYKFTAPSNGIITADTSGSSYDTILQAVTGSLGAFTSLACNDNVNAPTDVTSKVTFGAASGVTYFFMVSAFKGDGGASVFHLSFTATDFTVSGPSGAVTVNAGQSATFTITVSPAAAGFPLDVTFSASGLPMATTASFSPASVTPGSGAKTSTLTITTAARSMVPPRAPRPLQPVVLLWLAAAMLALLGLALLRQGLRRRRLALYLPVALLVFSAAYLVGCKGGGSTALPSGTPAGSFTITVTATSGGLSHTTTVMLTVN